MKNAKNGEFGEFVKHQAIFIGQKVLKSAKIAIILVS